MTSQYCPRSWEKCSVTLVRAEWYTYLGSIRLCLMYTRYIYINIYTYGVYNTVSHKSRDSHDLLMCLVVAACTHCNYSQVRSIFSILCIYIYKYHIRICVRAGNDPILRRSGPPTLSSDTTVLRVHGFVKTWNRCIPEVRCLHMKPLFKHK